MSYFFRIPFVLVAVFFGCASRRDNAQNLQTREALTLSTSIHTKQEFIPHTGPGPFSNYLSQEVFFPPVKQLHEDVQLKFGLKLKNRGEAHITVITPPEYEGVLKKNLSMQDINLIATQMDVQAASFKPVCVGMGRVKRNDRDEKTFYIVVESPRLIEIRQAVEDAFVAKGGSKDVFRAAKFFPHVTIGFTHTDLHESDGVIKNERSCVLNIEEK